MLNNKNLTVVEMKNYWMAGPPIFFYKSVYLHQNQICIVIDLFHLNWKMLEWLMSEICPCHKYICSYSSPTPKKSRLGPGGGALRYKGGPHPLYVFCWRRGLFKTSACPWFCKRRVLFCIQVRSMRGENPLTIHATGLPVCFRLTGREF